VDNLSQGCIRGENLIICIKFQNFRGCGCTTAINVASPLITRADRAPADPCGLSSFRYLKLRTHCQWHRSEIQNPKRTSTESLKPIQREAISMARNEPGRDSELVGDGRDVQREFPFLVKPNEVYLRQVGDLQGRDPRDHLIGIVHSKTATPRSRKRDGNESDRRLTRRQAEMGWCTMGWPASGNSGFGTFSDSGRNRVPAPNKSQTQSQSCAAEGRRGVRSRSSGSTTDLWLGRRP
jgi:hypothetical protein